VQFGRSIRGEHEQGHVRLVGLANGGVEFRGGGTAGDHNGDGPRRRQRTTKGEEGGTALVNAHVQGQLASLGRGESERRRT
jgi:hypothetical protein